MTAFLWPFVAAALSASVATLATLVLSRAARPRDAQLWHGVWTALALTSIVAPLAALAPSRWDIGVAIEPAALEAAGPGLSTIVVLVLGSGCAIFFWRLVAGLLLTLRIARRAHELTPYERAYVERVVPGVAADCRVHRRLRGPVSIGFRTPVIVLPETWRAWPADRLAVILKHEHAHARRRDFLWNFFAEVQRALYWWNPLAWIVARRVRCTAELASDRAAAGSETVAYARHLVATAQELSHSAFQAGVLAPGAVTDLAGRVEALLSAGSDRRVSRRVRHLAFGAIALGVLLTPLLLRTRTSTYPSSTNHAAQHAIQHAERHRAAGH